MPPKRRAFTPWSAGSREADALERPEDTVKRVRRKLNAARLQVGLSWEELFELCDKDSSQTVEWRECKHMCRDFLKVPVHVVSDNELRLVFTAADEDNNGTLDVAEFLAFLWHGPKTEELQEARKKLRIARVRRNLYMAFSKVGCTEAAARKLFQTIDLDGDSRLSHHEFDLFVRRDLALNRWHIMNSDLECFYRFLADRDGIHTGRFMEFLRQTHRPSAKLKLGPESFYAAPPSRTAEFKRKMTFRKELEKTLSRSDSLPAPSLSGPAFTSLGRDRPGRSRVFVDNTLF